MKFFFYLNQLVKNEHRILARQLLLYGYRRLPKFVVNTSQEIFMRTLQKGFTLIELMIVVAIIGILAAIAIPAYQDYTIRAQVSEGLSLASSVKASTSEFYADRGSWPADLTKIGITAASTGKYVKTVGMTNGTIVLTYGLQANSNVLDKTMSLKPFVSANNDVIWVCGLRAAPAGAVEAGSGASGAVATTLAEKYMPSNCRV
jgi:type IV pilus assembly protein PilA